jgi:hypothetical protein
MATTRTCKNCKRMCRTSRKIQQELNLRKGDLATSMGWFMLELLAAGCPRFAPKDPKPHQRPVRQERTAIAA